MTHPRHPAFVRSLRVLGSVGLALATLAPTHGWTLTEQDASRAATVAATAEPAFEILHQQARYWVNRGRGDLAAQALRRILASDPDNAEALYEIGLLMIGEGDITSARTFEARLRRQESAYALANQLRREVENAEVDRNLLNEARRRAAAGEIDVALGLYEKLFSGREIGGGLAIEYYETLAGMEPRWSEAADGLRQHFDRQPSNGRVRMALAKVLSYREESRRESLFHFAALLDDAAFRTEALAGMRDALLWLNASPEDQSYFERYLAVTDDEAVAEKLALALNPKVIDAFTAARIEAYKALNQGQLNVAEQRFTDLLGQRSNDAESLGGLGLVKLRRQQFGAAADYLTRAIRADAGTRRNFGQALADARFWGGHAESVRLLDQGRQDEALAVVSRLEPAGNSQLAQIHLLKARIASAVGTRAEVERHYRAALAADGTNADAAAGLLDVLASQRRFEELERQLAAFERQAASGAFGQPRVRAAMRRSRAQIAAWRQDWAEAVAAYEQAVRADTDNVWLRLEYARLLIRLGRSREAEALMATLSRPGAGSDGAHALALYYADTENWERCLAELERVPAAERRGDLKTLAESAEIKYRIALAMQRASMGDRTTAVNEMLSLQEFRTTSPYKTMLVADGLLKLGLGEQAGLMVKRALSGGGEAPVDILVQYARILGEAGELNAAYTLMTDLMLRRAELSAEQRGKMAAIYDDILLRASRRAIGAGQYQLALGYLEPIYRNNPTDGTVLRHLGEVHQKLGNFATSRKFYESAIAVDGRDLWAVKGAVGAALDEEDIAAATRILDSALGRFPNDPDIYTLVSRTAHSANDLDMAIEAMERAKALRRNRELPAVEPEADYQAPPGEQLPPISPQNPFRAEMGPRSSAGPSTLPAPVPPPREYRSQVESVGADATGWRFVKVAAPAPTEPQNPPPATSGWTLPSDGDALDEMIDSEIESTRRALSISAPSAAPRSVGGSGVSVALDLDTLYQLVALLAQQGKHHQVETVVLGALDGSHEEGARTRLVELLYPSALQLAEDAMDRGDHAAAFTHLRPVLGASRGESDVRFLRLMAHYSRATGEPDKAAVLFDRALSLVPGDEELRIEAVTLRMDMNDLPAASALANAGLELNPDSAQLHYLVGRMAKQLGDLDAALQHFMLAKAAQARSPQAAPARPEAVSPAWPRAVAPPAAHAVSAGVAAAPPPMPRASGPERVETLDLYGDPFAPLDANAAPGGRVVRVAAAESANDAPPAPASESSVDIRERLRSLGREGPAGRDSPATQRPSALGNALDSELEVLRAEASPFFGVGGSFRYRSGEAGLSKLTEFRGPLEFDFNPFEGRLKVQVEPVFLTAGDFGVDPNRIRRFGTFALVEEEARFPPTDDDAAGVGITFGYTTGDFSVDIGTTPLGFELVNAVGGINLTHKFDRGFQIGFDVSRRAVAESILSYAGLVDPLSGEDWGAVVNNEITVELSQSFDGYSVYGDVWYGVNTGQNVEDNEHFGTDFGFTVDLLQRPGRSLRAGFNTTYFSYDKNLRFFTLGHGGYFSPETFLSASIPIDYELSTDRLQLRFSGAVGVQYFSEDATFYFPDRLDLQLELFEFESEQPVIYDGQSDTDISFRTSAEVIYKLSPRFQVRGLLGVDRTADWTESVGLMTFQFRPGL